MKLRFVKYGAKLSFDHNINPLMLPADKIIIDGSVQFMTNARKIIIVHENCALLSGVKADIILESIKRELEEILAVKVNKVEKYNYTYLAKIQINDLDALFQKVSLNRSYARMHKKDYNLIHHRSFISYLLLKSRYVIYEDGNIFIFNSPETSLAKKEIKWLKNMAN